MTMIMASAAVAVAMVVTWDAISQILWNPRKDTQQGAFLSCEDSPK